MATIVTGDLYSSKEVSRSAVWQSSVLRVTLSRFRHARIGGLIRKMQ